jgi:lambda family phage portal protein
MVAKAQARKSAAKPAPKAASKRPYVPTGNPVGRPSNAKKAVAVAAGKAAGSGVIVNRYDAAGMGRRMRGWNPPTSGPNTAITGLQKIRDRARDSARNDWSGESGLQKWTTTLVGIGITPRFKRVPKGRKQAIIDLYNDWVKIADADCVLDFYGVQTLGVRAWLEAGEVFMRLRPRSVDAGLVVPFQVQLVEAEYVPLFDTDTFPGLAVGNKIRSGIEFNAYGRRIAYWMYKANPNDFQTLGTSSVPSAGNLIRVAASQVKHIYMPNRPGALRGVSMFASIMAKARDRGDYEDAVRLRQKLANLFVAFIKNELPDGTQAGDVDPLTNLPVMRSETNEPLAELAPGLFQELDVGQSVDFSNPPEAGTMYSQYVRTELMGEAAGQGMPYELFSGDIVNVSDRTLRVILNEFRRFAKQRQWQVIIPMLCQPAIEGFADACVLIGKVGIAEVENVKRVEWAPHGFEYIHPVQDPQGKKLEVDAGFRSRSSVIGERGDDPDEVDDERATDQEREKSLGIDVPIVLGTGESAGKANAGTPPAEPKKPAKAELVMHAELRNDIDTKLESATKMLVDSHATIVEVVSKVDDKTQASIAELKDELASERSINRSYREQETADRKEDREALKLCREEMLGVLARSQSQAQDAVQLAREAGDVSRRAVAVAEGALHVFQSLAGRPEQTIETHVHLPDQHIEAKAGDVKLTAVLSMPERVTTSTVTRDAKGDIKGVRQVEKDADDGAGA